MFLEDDHTDDALRAVADLASLLDQQEYEYQRLVAEIQLSVRELENVIAMRRVPNDIARQLESLPVNVKHSLRAGRESFGEARRYITDALDRVCSLEMREEW